MLLLSCNIVIAIHLKAIDFSPLCSKYKMEKIMMHKTYLVLGSSPKFHIVPWQDVRWRNPHFWDLYVERTKRNFPSSRVSQLWSHACEGTAFSLSFFQSPVESPKCESAFFFSTQAQGSWAKQLQFWWTELGSPQLNGADYEPSCAQVT